MQKKKMGVNNYISLPFKTLSNGHNACIIKYENVIQVLAEKVCFLWSDWRCHVPKRIFMQQQLSFAGKSFCFSKSSFLP